MIAKESYTTLGEVVKKARRKTLSRKKTESVAVTKSGS